jgi:hypothetical protein
MRSGDHAYEAEPQKGLTFNASWCERCGVTARQSPATGGWTHMEGRNSVECDPTGVLDNQRMIWRLYDKYPDVYSEPGFPRLEDA